MKARVIMIATALAALTLLSAGCKKHSFWTVSAGDQIRFAAKSNMNAGTQTKVVYNDNNGQYFSVGTSKYEALDWVEGDDMTIGYISAGGASGLNALYGDYFVDPSTIVPATASSNGISRTKILPVGGNGLQWQEGSLHQFYATSPRINPEDITSGEFYFRPNAARNNIDSQVPYYYPQTLDASKSEDMTASADGRTFVENMKYAYLNTFNGETARPDEDGMVTLTLGPHFTAFEITACADGEANIPLKGFTLSSGEDQLSGIFYLKYTIEEDNPETEDVDESDEYWKNIPKAGETSDAVYVDFSNISGGIKLSPATPVKITVFVRGGWYLDKITIGFDIEKNGETVNRSLKLQQRADSESPYYWMGFESNKKHRIYGLKVPLEIGSEPENLWFDGGNAGGYYNEGWND